MKKALAIILILTLMFNIVILDYEEAKADVIALTGSALAFGSGIGQVLLACAAVAFVGYIGYTALNNLWQLRHEIAYNNLTVSEQDSLNTLANSAVDGQVITTATELIEAGAEKFAQALTVGVQRSRPVPYVGEQGEYIYLDDGVQDSSINDIAYEIDSVITAREANSTEYLKQVKSATGADIEIVLEVDTTLGCYNVSMDRLYNYPFYIGEGYLPVLLNYVTVKAVANRETGVIGNIRDSSVGDVKLMWAYCHDMGTTVLDGYMYGKSSYDMFGYHDYVDASQKLKTVEAFATNIGEISFEKDVETALGRSICADDILAWTGFVGDGVFEYSPPIIEAGTLSMPQDIVIGMDTVLEPNLTGQVMVPFVPQLQLDINTDIADAIDTGIYNETVGTTTIDTGGSGGGTIPVGDIEADWEGIRDLLEGKMNITALKNAWERLQNMNTSKGSPPVININLHDIIGIPISHFDSGISNPFPDQETVFIDFGVLENYQFAGYSVVDYFRMLIGTGFIITTLLYIWRKLIPSKAIN